MRLLKLFVLVAGLSSAAASSQDFEDEDFADEPVAETDFDEDLSVPEDEGFAPTVPDIRQLQVDELAITQSELRKRRQTLLGVHFGAVYPWQSFGLSINWWRPDTDEQLGMSVGSGRFELSDVRDGRALFLDAKIQTVLASYRRQVRDYPIFFESFSGLEFWNAELRPRGNEQATDPEAASLISDFSGISAALGVKAGFIWHWESNIFIEFAILQGSGSLLLTERYTNNTSSARSMTRRQVQSFRNWGGVNLKIGIQI